MTKIIFMGTPAFSATVLEGLLTDERYDIVAVVTQPDRAVGRKKEIRMTPVLSLIHIFVGESGSGKTTIGRAIIGLNDTSNGEIIFDGKKINGYLSHSEKNDLIRRIQMIFQDPAASLNERATVDYILSEGLYNFHLYKDEDVYKRQD